MSDYADKAAETRDAILKYVWVTDGQLLCNPEKIDAIIRTSTPDRDRLVEAVKAMILLVEDYDAKTCKVIRAAITIGKGDWQAEAKERELAMHKMFGYLDTLRAALADCKPKVCIWSPDIGFDDSLEKWDTECGTAFCPVGGELSDHYIFCPRCGGKIEVKESSE